MVIPAAKLLKVVKAAKWFGRGRKVTKGGKAAKKSARTYAPRVRARGLHDPKSHNFPYSFDDGIMATKPTRKPNNYKIYQKSGSMNGKEGVYEIGVRSDGVVDHRFFRPLN